jgi:ATP-dependent DNA ligase
MQLPSDWLKIKARLQQEFVVGGFTAPKGSRKYLGAVVLGTYTKGKLQHYSYAGSGFSEKVRFQRERFEGCSWTNEATLH